MEMCTRTLFFGDFRLDPANQQLWRSALLLPLRPKTYAVLLYLALNSQRLITKNELLKNVWGEVAVNEGLLRGYIHELRQALGDRPKAS